MLKRVTHTPEDTMHAILRTLICVVALGAMAFADDDCRPRHSRHSRHRRSKVRVVHVQPPCETPRIWRTCPPPRVVYVPRHVRHMPTYRPWVSLGIPVAPRAHMVIQIR